MELEKKTIKNSVKRNSFQKILVKEISQIQWIRNFIKNSIIKNQLKNVSKKSQEISFTPKIHLWTNPQNISQEKIIKISSDNINTKRITQKNFPQKN